MDIKKEETHVKKTEITDFIPSKEFEEEKGERKSIISDLVLCFLTILAFVIVTGAAIVMYKWSLSIFSDAQLEKENITVQCNSDTTVYINKERKNYGKNKFRCDSLQRTLKRI